MCLALWTKKECSRAWEHPSGERGTVIKKTNNIDYNFRKVLKGVKRAMWLRVMGAGLGDLKWGRKWGREAPSLWILEGWSCQAAQLYSAWEIVIAWVVKFFPAKLNQDGTGYFHLRHGTVPSWGVQVRVEPLPDLRGRIVQVADREWEQTGRTDSFAQKPSVSWIHPQSTVVELLLEKHYTWN